MAVIEKAYCPECYSENCENIRLVEGKRQFGFEYECKNCGTVFKIVIITVNNGPTRPAITADGKRIKPAPMTEKEKKWHKLLNG